MLRVLYLVPNLGDPAAERRVRMLRLGGAYVKVAGFRRGDDQEASVSGPFTELGRPLDARFLHRLVTVAGAYWSILGHFDPDAQPDVIMARNLEMLPLAARLQRAWGDQPALVYECLDIHRLLIGHGPVARAMRAVEAHFMRRSGLLITSSPGLIRDYFDAMGQPDIPTLLLENKVLPERRARGTNPALRSIDSARPLRIGWFGGLRCQKSLDVLGEFTTRMAGRVEVVMRGRPAPSVAHGFRVAVRRNPYFRYEGPYRSDELLDIYSQVHLAWAIDFFEERRDSRWLLPDRIYEACLHGAIPVAVDGTETAAFLRSMGVGIVLPDMAPNTLETQLGGLGPAELRRLAGAVALLDRRLFAFESTDCTELVAMLSQLKAVGKRRWRPLYDEPGDVDRPNVRALPQRHPDA